MDDKILWTRFSTEWYVQLNIITQHSNSTSNPYLKYGSFVLSSYVITQNLSHLFNFLAIKVFNENVNTLYHVIIVPSFQKIWKIYYRFSTPKIKPPFFNKTNFLRVLLEYFCFTIHGNETLLKFFLFMLL